MLETQKKHTQKWGRRKDWTQKKNRALFNKGKAKLQDSKSLPVQGDGGIWPEFDLQTLFLLHEADTHTWNIDKSVSSHTFYLAKEKKIEEQISLNPV